MSVDFEDPQVHFIGELSHLLIESMQFPLEEAAFYSISYCVVPGNDLWKLHDGKSFGETQACMIDELSGFITLNHPINLFYNTTSIEGWPCLVVEVSKLPFVYFFLKKILFSCGRKLMKHIVILLDVEVYGCL